MSDEEFDKTLRDLDWKIKYGRFEEDSTTDNTPQTSQNYPQDLKDLEETYHMNEEKLSELRQIEERDEKQQKEFNKRLNFSISIRDDIKQIKDSYSIRYEDDKVENFKDWNALSYDSRMDDTNCTVVGKEDDGIIIDNIKLSMLKDVAKDVLDDKEYKIFELYFFISMSQNEIAKIIGDSQSTVSRFIRQIIEKLKKSLKSF